MYKLIIKVEADLEGCKAIDALLASHFGKVKDGWKITSVEEVTPRPSEPDDSADMPHPEDPRSNLVNMPHGLNNLVNLGPGTVRPNG